MKQTAKLVVEALRRQSTVAWSQDFVFSPFDLFTTSGYALFIFVHRFTDTSIGLRERKTSDNALLRCSGDFVCAGSWGNC